MNSRVDIKVGHLIEDEIETILKKLKTEKLQATTKYVLKYGRRENLSTYFFDYRTLCTD